MKNKADLFTKNKTESQIEDLIKKIETLTVEVEDLKKRVKGNNSKQNEKELQIGDKVAIKNPRRGQAASGFVCRIGEEYVTVETKKGKVVRKIHNVRKVKSITEDNSV